MQISWQLVVNSRPFLELAICIMCIMNIITAETKHSRIGWAIALIGWLFLSLQNFYKLFIVM